jgi:hypothetical protein
MALISGACNQCFLSSNQRAALSTVQRQGYRRVAEWSRGHRLQYCGQDHATFLQRGVAAARRALAEAGVEPAEISGLVVNTCTGYLCPGLSSYIAEDLGLKTSIRFLDLMGWGAVRRSRILKPLPACWFEAGKVRSSALPWKSVQPPFSPVMSRNWW